MSAADYEDRRLLAKLARDGGPGALTAAVKKHLQDFPKVKFASFEPECDGASLMSWAAIGGRCDNINALVALGAGVGSGGSLAAAVSKGQTAAVELLLCLKVSPNRTTARFGTPLQALFRRAPKKDDKQIASALLEYKSDFSAKWNEDGVAIDCWEKAAQSFHSKHIEILHELVPDAQRAKAAFNIWNETASDYLILEERSNIKPAWRNGAEKAFFSIVKAGASVGEICSKARATLPDGSVGKHWIGEIEAKYEALVLGTEIRPLAPPVKIMKASKKKRTPPCPPINRPTRTQL